MKITTLQNTSRPRTVCVRGFVSVVAALCASIVILGCTSLRWRASDGGMSETMRSLVEVVAQSRGSGVAEAGAIAACLQKRYAAERRAFADALFRRYAHGEGRREYPEALMLESFTDLGVGWTRESSRLVLLHDPSVETLGGRVETMTDGSRVVLLGSSDWVFFRRLASWICDSGLLESSERGENPPSLLALAFWDGRTWRQRVALSPWCVVGDRSPTEHKLRWQSIKFYYLLKAVAATNEKGNWHPELYRSRLVLWELPPHFGPRGYALLETANRFPGGISRALGVLYAEESKSKKTNDGNGDAMRLADPKP